MKFKLNFICILSLLFLFSCTNPINLRTAQRYHDAGTQAEAAGDYKVAQQNYYRAYMNTEWGNADQRKKALAMYNLGRMNGYLCRKSEAEELLLKSIEIEGKETNKSGNWYIGRILETSRFYYDYGDYEKSIPYFEEGIDLLRKGGSDNTSPLEVANVLEDYAGALRKIGRNEDASKANAQMDALRENNRDKSLRFIPVRYKQDCEKVK